MKLSEQIIKIRTDNNLTQEEFANALFVTRQAVSKWERGKSVPDIETLKQISIKFNVSLNVLLEIIEYDKSTEKKILGKKSYKNIVLYSITLLLCIFLYFLYIKIYLVEHTFSPVSKIMLVVVSILLIINVILLLVNLSRPKVLIEYNDYGIYINYPKVVFLKYDEIIDVKIYHRRIKRILSTFGTVTVITKNSEINVNGVADINEVQKKLIELKTKNTVLQNL